MTGCDLEMCLLAYDGKDPSALIDAREACGDALDFLDRVIAFCGDARPLVSEGASWILKAELDVGAHLTAGQSALVVAQLERLATWAAALHVLQVVEHLTFCEEDAQIFLTWAQGFADHRRPFVRAWSLHARVFLGRRYPALNVDVAAELVRAEDDPAASVRARARRLWNG